VIATLIPVGIVAFLVGAALGTGRRGLSMIPKSPVRGILIVRWTRFHRLMARHPRHYDSAGHLGAWGMNARSLYDAGLVDAPKKVTIGRDVGIWSGEWKRPLTKEMFLGSLPIQSRAFELATEKLVPVAAPHVGAIIDGKMASLSGLLGVGHVAGAAGMADWVKNPASRTKFARTTETFNLTNGVF
jgi:hypothetical protein